MTFVATANAVLYAGAEVRFADVAPGTLLIDPELVAAGHHGPHAGDPAGRLRGAARRLRGHPQHRGSGAGGTVDDHRRRLALPRGDARRAAVGTLADMTVLSLHPAKIMTTGEGGAVLTDRDDLADRLRRFRNHGIATELAARTIGPTRWSSSATTTG